MGSKVFFLLLAICELALALPGNAFRDDTRLGSEDSLGQSGHQAVLNKGFLLLLFLLDLSLSTSIVREMLMDTTEFVRDAPPTAILAIGAFAILALTFAIREFLNPLSKIPGPWIAKYTNIYSTYQFLRGNKPRYVHHLHNIYGPIVRVGPHEVDIADISAVKEIHRVGGKYLKNEFYDNIGHRGSRTLFNQTDPHLHAIRRKLLSAGMARTSVVQLESDILQRIQLTIQRMQEESKDRGVIDVFKWWTFMAADVITQLSFGESFGTTERGLKTPLITALQNQSFFMAVRTTFPSLLPYAQLLPLPLFKEVQAGGQQIFGHARQAVGQYKRMVDGGLNAKKTLFSNLLKSGTKDLTEMEIIQEACGYIVAGSDTTAITLTYLVWAVCKIPSIRDRLAAEVKDLPDGFSEERVRDLPYLNQVINEALRIHSAVPSALPRRVPPEGTTLGGYYIPGGATVSTQAYTLHRDEKLFPDSESFNPSRWENPSKEMNAAFMPFGGGSRGK
ncbi:putative sterigmatocystin biosynthesis P450 monooxygenase STCB [Talaromyces islandicus]|uniref:Putative sterigmatocystin biosynthesis P450 monooxygenase STCB n=1 Tax=Talaromyces islandicus TaxID=28573 RepID=A0A0U1LJ77_TALIS|nr:putative sterigmatocystin biosynthesis P450 monooxygenase STCB [Talaromyces islandicus]